MKKKPPAKKQKVAFEDLIEEWLGRKLVETLDEHIELGPEFVEGKVQGDRFNFRGSVSVKKVRAAVTVIAGFLVGAVLFIIAHADWFSGFHL